MIAHLLQHQTALRGQFLGLPGLRRSGAAVIDRHAGGSDDRGLVRAERPQRGVSLDTATDAALDRDLRQQAALRDTDGGGGHFHVVTRGDDSRVLAARCIGRFGECRRRQPVDGGGRHQRPRRLADHLGIGFLADGIGHFGRIEVGQAAAQPGLGLGGVGRGDVTGIEPLAGDGEGLFQEVDIGTLGFDQGLVGQHVHVGGDAVQQHALADVAQRLAAGFDLKLSHPDAVGGLEAVEQHLGHGDADGPGPQGGVGDDIAGQQVADLLQTGAEAGHDLGPVAGQRLRHVLVGGALAGPLRIELWIGLIGLHQGLREGFRSGGTVADTEASRRDHDNSHAETQHSSPCGFGSHITPDHNVPQPYPKMRP